MHSPMPTTLHDIKEEDSFGSIVFNLKFALVKLFVLLDVVLWRMDIVVMTVMDEPRNVCLIWFDIAFCICGGIGIRVTGLIFGIEAALLVGIVIGRRVHN